MEENTMKKIVSERKIKHWQGYGVVDAKVLKKTNDTLVIRVSGNHEYGLDCDKYDTYRVYEWLVKRFDPSKKESDIQSVDIDDRYERVGNIDQEVCDYTIHFGEGNRWGMWQESAETLKDIERGYGLKVAKALAKYCELKKLDVDDVVSDMSEDGNGMTAWDKFDVWAQKVQKLDIMGNFDDTTDWTGAEDKERKEREREKEEKMHTRKLNKDLKELRKNKKDLKNLRRDMRKGRKLARESEENVRMEENDILDWIFQEMGECEWAKDMEYVDDANAFEVAMPGPDGDVFRVNVQKVWSGRLGTRID